MYLCPITSTKLVPASAGGASLWYSPSSRGRLITYSVAKKFFGRDEAREIWIRARKNKAQTGWKKCPSCSRHMVIVKEPRWIGGHEIDVCLSCHLLWIDADEHIEVPHPEDLLTRDGDTTPISQAADLAAETTVAKQRKEFEDKQVIGKGPDGPGQIFGILGLPVKYDEHYYDSKPWITWFFAASMWLIHLFRNQISSSIRNDFGLLADNIFSNPFSIFSWTFFHYNWVHLVVNIYLIGLVADDIEHYIGRRKFFLCMLLLPLTTGFFTAIARYDATAPVIGANSIVVALLVLYALIFRKSRLAILSFYNHTTVSNFGVGFIQSLGWFRVGAIWVVILYVIKDYLFFYSPFRLYNGPLILSAPIAGAIFGFVTWLLIGAPNWYTDQEKMKKSIKSKLLMDDLPIFPE